MLCSSVSPEAPLMVQATIIFLFRICLGGLINLLRIHNSIYQNNGTLLGSHQQKKRSLIKIFSNWMFENWPPFHYPALSNALCPVVAASWDGELEKLFRSWQSLFQNRLWMSAVWKGSRLWRSRVTRATLTSHYQTIKLVHLQCSFLLFLHVQLVTNKPFWSEHTSGKFTAGIWVGTILIHLGPITPSVLGPFDVDQTSCPWSASYISTQGWLKEILNRPNSAPFCATKTKRDWWVFIKKVTCL